jgi:hypothetical protein
MLLSVNFPVSSGTLIFLLLERDPPRRQAGRPVGSSLFTAVSLKDVDERPTARAMLCWSKKKVANGEADAFEEGRGQS